jgi:hypothetical protein
MSPSASAASVPGSGRTCQSADAAVRVRSGSMTTTRAPALRAAWTIGHWCRLVTIVFVPHSTMSRLCARSSGRRPTSVPAASSCPAAAACPQIVRSRREAPRWAKKRRSIDAPCTRPCVPAKL